MGHIGHGYGSEWQLMWHLARHRTAFDGAIARQIGADAVRWLDFPGADGDRADREWRGIEFIDSSAVRAAWSEFWPQRGNPPNWDAIGHATVGGNQTWLLVEAKAHLAELRSSCAAIEKGGLGQIQSTLALVKEREGVDGRVCQLVEKRERVIM